MSSPSSNYDEIEKEGNQIFHQNYNPNDSGSHLGEYQKNLKQKTYKKKFKNKIFLCKECHYIPKLKLKYENKALIISCKCKKCINIKPRNFIERYRCKKRITKVYSCKEHEKKYFKYYCIDCKQNLCEECAKNEIHYNHIKTFELLEVGYKTDDIIKQIEEIRTKLQSGDIENRQIPNIFEVLVYNYNSYPCHNQYHNLFEAEKFLTALESEIPKMEKIEMMKINNINDLELYKSQSHLFSSIHIKDKIFNLSSLKDLTLNNLESLQLRNKQIENLDVILNKEFDKLKNLNLTKNKLTYKSLEKLDPRNFKNLETLNLYINEIKSIKIFFKLAEFENLKKLHIGENKFDLNEINKNNKKINLSKLELLGITGSLSDDTSKFLPYLVCKNLEVLYISRNNLSSIKFMKDCQLKKLKKFWAINNKLSGNIKNILEYLPSKETLEIINLEGNKINNLDGFDEIINKFPKLKEINLKNNNIDLAKYKKLIKNIEEFLI